MEFQLSPLAFAYLFVGILDLIVAGEAWRRHSAEGSIILTLIMLAAGEWAFAIMLEVMSVGIPAKIFWSKVAYLGTVSCPPLVFMFALVSTHKERWFTRRNMILLWMIPVATFLLAATNEWHGQIWSSFTPSPDPNSNLIIYGHDGIFFWVHCIYAYFLAVAANVLFIWGAVHFQHIYRRQMVALAFSVSIIWIVNVAYNFKLIPIPGLDLTPIAFSIAGFMLIFSFYRLRLFDIVPVAHQKLIESMRDGLIVLDDQDRIVEVNPSAEEIFECSADQVIGLSLTAIFRENHIDLENIEELDQISRQRGEILRTYSVNSSSLINRKNIHSGWMLIFHDITEQKQAEEALHKLAITDSLTGCFNRRHFFNLSRREFARSRRYKRPLSLIMTDIDGFKDINDRYGHLVGDQVLVAFAEHCQGLLREIDIFARYGGDEFVILFPATDSMNVQHVAERMRKKIEGADIETSAGTLSIIMGIASITAEEGLTLDIMFERADQALYESKEGGRNQVTIWQG